MQKIESIYIKNKCEELLAYSVEAEWSAKEIVSEMWALMSIFRKKLDYISETHIM